MLGDNKLQVATSSDCRRLMGTNSNDYRQLITERGARTGERRDLLKGGAGYWNIKEGGAASRDLSGKSDAMKVLRYGAF